MARQINRLNPLQAKALTKTGRHADGGGLYLAIDTGGRKRWVFLFRDRRTKKLREMGLGSFADTTLARARDKAKAAREHIDAGRDPIIAAKAQRNAGNVPTFGEMADQFVEAMEGQWRNEKHRAQWRMTLEEYANTSELITHLSGGSQITVRLLHRTRGQRAGVRLYFHCPRCWRACELLYASGNSLACRVCLRLAYRCENLGRAYRDTERLYRLRRRLGQEPNGAFDVPPDRPKRMHWTTYERKIDQIDRLEDRANETFCASTLRLLQRWDRTFPR